MFCSQLSVARVDRRDIKQDCSKWKNHFSEMKGDVRMSPYEKRKGKKGMPTPKQKLIHNPIPPSLLFVSLNIVFLKKLSTDCGL